MVLLLVGFAIDARADGPGRFTIQQPGRVSLTLFSSGFGSDLFDDPSWFSTRTEHYSLCSRGRAGYGLPGVPGRGIQQPVCDRVGTRTLRALPARNRHYPGAGCVAGGSGGHDVGNADKSVIEGDFSGWLFLHSRHPIDFSFTSTHFDENGITSTLIDVRTIVYSTGKWLFLAGEGGAFWGGGTEGKPNGQGGPDLGIFLREWDTRIDLQSGYGSSHLTVWSPFPRL